jgi:hypothetical protein
MKKPIKEAISGGVLTPAESAPINYIHSNPVVKAIVEIFKKDKALKDVEVVKILEDGDVYHMDLRFDIPDAPGHAQYAREEGKHRSYDIKRQLEIALMSKFNIPSFSIAGVRVVQGKTTFCEFSISFIYANKGNIKPTNESMERDQRVRSLVEAALKTKKKAVNPDPLKEALEQDIADKIKPEILSGAYTEKEVYGLIYNAVLEWTKTSYPATSEKPKRPENVAKNLMWSQDGDFIMDVFQYLDMKIKNGIFVAKDPIVIEDGQMPIKEDGNEAEGIFINGKKVDIGSLHIENIDMKDYPDFCDAFVGEGYFEDGTEMTDQEMDEFNDKHSDVVQEKAHESLYESTAKKRDAALNFLERMGDIKRKEEE